MSDQIIPIVMPKWGLSMQEGRLTAWHVKEGDVIEPGQDIMDVETDKIANVVEAADGGLLRRCVAQEDTVYPVRALLGVLAPDAVSDEEIDAYVAAFEVPEIEEDEEEQAPAYLFIETPFGRLRYAERGTDGDAFVLIHGFGGDLDNWLFNIDDLARGGRVFALDLPGHGQSEKRVEAGVDGLVDTLDAFMDAVGVDSAHLVGHSMGGAISAMLALKKPEKAKSLTLVDSAGLGTEINSGYIDGFISAETRRELKPVVGDLFADKDLVSRQLIDDLLKFKRLDGVDEALRSIAASAFDGGRQIKDLAGDIESSDIPVLVIWGDEDAIIPAAHADAVPRASVEVLPGVGHMPQMEAAGKVNGLIRAFVGLS